MSQTYAPPDRATSRSQLLLTAVLLALTLAALAFVLGMGTNAPYADEWEFVPVITGNEPFGPWLWQQHNEHRMPLPRTIWYWLFQLTHDFRAGMVVQVGLLAGLSWWLMHVAAQLRGRPLWADAFFPISLLHLGHWENFLMGYQLCFALFALLATALGVVALKTTRETIFRSGVLAGVLVTALALCGGFGLPLALCGAGWVGYLGIVEWRTRPKWKSLLLLGLACIPIVYTACYLQGYQRPPGHPTPSTEPGTDIVLVTGETLAMAFGIGIAGVWWVLFGALLAIGVFTLSVCAKWLKSAADRPAAVGVLAVAAGVVGLALAIGIGRAGFGHDAGLWARYSLLTWPLLGLMFLVWVKQGGRPGKWIPIGLCVTVAFAFPTNMGTGIVHGVNLRNGFDVIEADARAGASPEQIAARFARSPHDGQQERAIRGVPMLRAARIGAFAGK